jgi:hypothetical protein
MRHWFGWIVILFIGSLQGCGGASNRDQLADAQTPQPTGVLFTSAPSGITLAVGSAASSYNIGGGKLPYTASGTDERVAIGRVSGTTLIITPIALGTTQILVSDGAGGQVPINVTVAGASPVPLSVAAPSAVSVFPSVVPATYALIGGTPPYTVQTSNAVVATAAVSGKQLSVTGLALGTATVSVFDATGAQASLAVTVVSSTGASLTVAPNGATGSVGDVLRFVLRGGSPGYILTSNNTSIASLSSATVAASGSTFTVTLTGVGDAVITIADAQNQVASFTVTAGTASPQLRVSPSAFLIGENDASTVALSIYGGTPPYTALTSDTLKTSVGVVGNVVNTTPGTSGSRCINPVTDADPPVYVVSGTYAVTITVIDSLGATGSSVMTIKDNGAGLGLGCP